MSEFWAAIAGAVVGGGIAAAVQWLAISHATRERKRGLAYSLLLKVGQIYSHLRLLNGHFEKTFKDASAADQANPWSILEGMAGSLSRVTFSAEEAALVLELNDAKALSDLLTMDEKHNATFDALDFYGVKRAELLDALTPEHIDGDHGFAAVPVALRPKIIALNKLADSMRKYVAGDAGHAINVLQQLAGESPRLDRRHHRRRRAVIWPRSRKRATRGGAPRRRRFERRTSSAGVVSATLGAR